MLLEFAFLVSWFCKSHPVLFTPEVNKYHQANSYRAVIWIFFLVHFSIVPKDISQVTLEQWGRGTLDQRIKITKPEGTKERASDWDWPTQKGQDGGEKRPQGKAILLSL